MDFLIYEKHEGKLVPTGVIPTLLAQHIRETERYFLLDTGGEKPPWYWYDDNQGVYNRLDKNLVMYEIKKHIEAVDPQLVRTRDLEEVYKLLITDKQRVPIDLVNYIDTDGTERSSLAHGHSLVSSYAEWTDPKSGEERKGINGKNFQTRPKMNELNKAIDEMCRREFGVPYMTGKGKGKGSGKSVEEVKTETQLRMAKKENEDFVRSLEVEQTKTTKGFLGREKEISKTPEEIQRDKEVKAAQAVLKDKDNLAERERSIAERERKIAQRESELTADEEKLAEYAAQVDDDAKIKVAVVEQKYQAQLNAINEQREQEKQLLLAKVESKLKELSQQIKVAKDATFAAIAQKAAYVLKRVPLPATTGLFVRGDYCREQTSQKER